MSFRNISQRQDFAVLRTRSKQPSDEKKWHNIYPPQLSKFSKVFNKFAVANWIPAVVGITSGIAAAVAGFYLGQKYSTMNIAKKFAKGAIDLLPKKMQKHARKYV